MYQKIPTRSASNLDSAADMNQVQLNIEALKGGDPNVAPTRDMETLDADLFTAEEDLAGVIGDLSAHEGLSSGVHGVVGSVVGTSDAQDLTAKRMKDFTETKLTNGLYGGATAPDGTTKTLNWDGYFKATKVYNAVWN